MPFITIKGLPDTVRDTQALADLILQRIPEAVASVQELGFTKDKVTTFADRDLLQEGLGTEIVGFIESGGFNSGNEQLQQLACERVATLLEEFAAEQAIDWHLIEVIPRGLSRHRAERSRASSRSEGGL